jgi:hypothetical protein
MFFSHHSDVFQGVAGWHSRAETAETTPTRAYDAQTHPGWAHPAMGLIALLLQTAVRLFFATAACAKMPSGLWLVVALPVLLRLLRSPRGPSREEVLPPTEERVVLLGASSGVGRDLAHAYARRGGRM